MTFEDDYITTVEAARLLGVSRWAVWRYCSADMIPAIMVGNRFFIKRKDVKKFKKPANGRPPKSVAAS